MINDIASMVRATNAMVKVANALDLGYQKTSEILDDLKAIGFSNYEAFLTYKAGELIHKSRRSAFNDKQAGIPLTK